MKRAYDKDEISKSVEEKRLNDFKRIADNWEQLPLYMQGKLDGIITTYAALIPDNRAKIS